MPLRFRNWVAIVSFLLMLSPKLSALVRTSPLIFSRRLQQRFSLSRRSMSSNCRSIAFVTGNKNKLEEVQKLLATKEHFPFVVTNQKIDLPELQGDDPIQIAQAKCRLAAEQIQGPCFIEDTSLCFNALKGLPGPYIKWFLDKCGHDGLNRMLVGFDDSSAYAQTVFCFTTGINKAVHVFEGRTNGKIVQPRGAMDFGWDPIFEPVEGKGRTYAEMSKDEKNEISHRSRAMKKFCAYLRESTDEIVQELQGV